MATRALANLSHESAKRPKAIRRQKVLKPEGSCDNWLVAVQTTTLTNDYQTNNTDISVATAKRFSL